MSNTKLFFAKMGHSNYELTDEQKRELDRIADAFIYKIENELVN